MITIVIELRLDKFDRPQGLCGNPLIEMQSCFVVVMVVVVGGGGANSNQGDKGVKRKQ